jgi:DNA repair exonuclease SbcCD ATPase subunit
LPRRREQESKKAEAEEKFGSIEEEVEKKTRKLEKLIRKVSEAEREVSDLSSEFQREREEMLDTIRQLARQIKLKDCILEGFAPAHKVKALEERAECSVEINQCVGCTRQSFTKSFIGDGAAVLARSSGEEPASPRHRAGGASMAWRTTRRVSTNAP